jgi:hypothetical protein
VTTVRCSISDATKEKSMHRRDGRLQRVQRLARALQLGAQFRQRRARGRGAHQTG